MAAETFYTPSSANVGGVDRRLTDILRKAAAEYGLGVRVTPSGGAVRGRRSKTSQHVRGKAIDIQLIDKAGNALPNYQNPAHFKTYEQFAQTARAIQQQDYPELNDSFRWGGYFGGALGTTYGAMDLMHFDLGPTSKMAAGTWEKGLKPSYQTAWGVNSAGMGTAIASSKTPIPPADVGTTNQVLKKGVYNNDHVKALQHVLSRAGLYDGKIDGDFGEGTERAVKAFQEAQNKLNAAAGLPPLAVDGIVGPQTKLAVATWGKTTAGPEAVALASSIPPGRLSDEFVRLAAVEPVARADVPQGAIEPPGRLPQATPTPFDMARQTPDVPVGPLGTSAASQVPDRALGPLAPAVGPDPTTLSKDDFLRSVMPDVAPGMVRPNAPSVTGNQIGQTSQFPAADPRAAAIAELRDKMARQPPVPRPNPMDFSGASGAVQQQVLDEDTKRQLTRELLGFDPRNPPVEAGNMNRATPTQLAFGGATGRGQGTVVPYGPPSAVAASARPESPGASFMRGWGDARPPTGKDEGPGILTRAHEGLGNASDAIRDFLGLNYAPDNRGGSFVNNTPVTHDAPTRTLTTGPRLDRAGTLSNPSRQQMVFGPPDSSVVRSAPARSISDMVRAAGSRQGSIGMGISVPSSPPSASVKLNMAPRGLPSLPSREVGYAPGMAPPSPAMGARAASELQTYQPTDPMAASAAPINDIRPPRPGLFTPAPQQPQIPKALQIGLPAALSMVNPILGGIAGLAMNLGGRGLLSGTGGLLGGNPAVAAQNARVAGGVLASDRIGNTGASYGRKQSDGSVTGTTSRGTGYTSRDGGREISVGGKTYRQNKNGRGYARVL